MNGASEPNAGVDLRATIGDRPDRRAVSGSHRTGPLWWRRSITKASS